MLADGEVGPEIGDGLDVFPQLLVRNGPVELRLAEAGIERHRQRQIVDGLARMIQLAPVEDAAILICGNRPIHGAIKSIDSRLVFPARAQLCRHVAVNDAHIMCAPSRI